MIIKYHQYTSMILIGLLNNKSEKLSNCREKKTHEYCFILKNKVSKIFDDTKIEYSFM